MIGGTSELIILEDFQNYLKIEKSTLCKMEQKR